MTLPVGAIIPYGGTAAPSGFLLCYGQAVSRTTYSDLFSIVGTTYGPGNGSTTFNLPDLRGRVAAGQDDMGGTSANRLTGQSGGVDGDVLGGAGGLETHTLTTAQLAAHSHTGTTSEDGEHQHDIEEYNTTHPDEPLIRLFNSNVTQEIKAQSTTVYEVPGLHPAGDHTHTLSINNAGGGEAHNNVQPTLILNYIIAVGAEVDNYVTEDGADNYVTEDGADNYVTEN